MAKINKLFIKYDHFSTNCEGIYITTFKNNVKRSLQRDNEGFFFILNKDIERITDAKEIERITNFLNIK